MEEIQDQNLLGMSGSIKLGVPVNGKKLILVLTTPLLVFIIQQVFVGQELQMG